MSKVVFPLGTIVKLKSGGPEMMVNEVMTNFQSGVPTGNIRCQWFAGKKLDSGVFPVENLELVIPEPK